MIRHSEPGICVRISDDALRRAANDNALLQLADVRRIERIHAAVAWVSAIALGLMMGYAAAGGG